MKVFKTPLKDIRFINNELFDVQAHYKSLPGGDEITPDLVDAIANECSKFAENIIFPLNQSGDQQGCQFQDGKVTTPKGYQQAYQQWIKGGWQGLSHPVEYGGQGLPLSLGVMKSEITGTANWAFGMYPGLSLGAINTLFVHGDDEQKNTYMRKLIEGTWTGTMCLTESHCGSDLGQMKTKAQNNEDGSYTITGTKIFISGGEHDLAENIVHITLARIPGSPKGTKGISLFVVPKYLPDENFNVGQFNQVSCGSIEHKMGIHGSSTCTMNFDGSKGFLLGGINNGLSAMFTFMNSARIGTAIQGIGTAELSFQNALAYAKERRSMRPLSGAKAPEHSADTIINHPDVRRMLLKQKAIAEGGRAMLYDASILADHMVHAKTPQALDDIDDQLGFVTPILKGFFTEMGIEAANDGMQVFGGHGYIAEWGMEQIARDVRISSLYEGTTGIQGLDLLGRKVILNKFKQYLAFNKRILSFSVGCLISSPYRWKMLKFIVPLMTYQLRWQKTILAILLKARKNRDAVGASTYDFLMYSGFMLTAFYWAMMAHKAMEKLDKGGNEEPSFYQTKIQTARFYFERMLPRAKAHAAIVSSSLESVTAMEEENFSLE
jgi:3-(methylsulfanyl)propanoyl-CoA dehydrogenase